MGTKEQTSELETFLAGLVELQKMEMDYFSRFSAQREEARK